MTYRNSVLDCIRVNIPEPHGRNGVIYFAVRASDGAIKIGWTGDVLRRVRELRRDEGCSVELAACLPGAKPDELRLHATFAADRLGGEWFRASPDLVAYVYGRLAA